MNFKIKREAYVGLFVTLTLLSLYWGVNFLKGKNLFNSHNTYYATYSQVSGIQKSAPILVKGFRIGSVTDIEYDPSVSENVIMTFLVNSDYNIPSNSNARIFSDGLVGGKAVEIQYGNSTQYLNDGDTLRSMIDKDLLEVAGNEFEQFKAMATQITTELTTTLKRVNELLEVNAESVNSTLTNVASLTKTVDELALSEKENISSIVRNIESLTTVLEVNSGQIESIIGNVNNFTDSLSRANIPQLASNLNKVMIELNITLAGINTGKGSVGRLLNDEALYDSLAIATSKLGLLLEDVKANPGRYVQFSVFGKKAK